MTEKKTEFVVIVKKENKMEILFGLCIIITLVGVLLVCIAGFAVFTVAWWFVIPCVFAYYGVWIGFFFGLGLTAIISLIVFSIKK